MHDIPLWGDDPTFDGPTIEGPLFAGANPHGPLIDPFAMQQTDVDERALAPGALGKASDALLDLAAPILDDDVSDEEFWARLEFARMAWNLAVFEADGRDRTSLETIRAQFAAADYGEDFDMLRARKRERFGHDPREMLSVSVSRTPDGKRYVQAVGMRTD